MAEGERAGGVQSDLEKELTCSICTELLYQPLTLLDCLHTFCGACLKEWFAFQASTATSIHPYTCPSCRASVRTTQPNAFTNTLLVSFLKEHPERGKSEEDKKSDREKYKRGDNVLPKLRKREEPHSEEDSRLLEEVQQLSLREVGIPSGASSSLEPPRDRRRRARSRERSRESRRSHDERGSSRNTPETSVSREVIPPRAIEHQSSLRSLLSASEMDPQEMEEEVRQIIEEGLLDGIDMNNIDVALEDEITERIMHAVQKRQAERQRERRERRERLAREGLVSSSGTSTPRDLRSPTLRDDEQARRRQHGRSESGTSTPQNSSRPPISRPNLIEAANQGHRTHHRRSSSQGSSRSARRADHPAPILISSARSTNLEVERPVTSDSASSTRRRQSEGQRRAALDERQQFRNNLQVHSSSNPNSPRRAAFNIPTSESPTVSTPVLSTPTGSPPPSAPASTPFQPPSSRRTTDPTATRQPRPSGTNTPPTATPPAFPRSSTDPTSHEPRSRQPSAIAPVDVPAPTVYPEPQISCKRCGKEHIEYELHYNCSRCDDGQYDLCLPCYRLGKGCKHWFGFGWAAWQRYERQAPPGGYPPSHQHPHILVGRRYRRPLSRLTESAAPPHVLMSDDDPALRLETGVFCDTCKAYANACYWKCDMCNEGDWGFCNDCVNKGRHCTHPLLPIAHKGKETASNSARPDVSSPAGPSQGLAPPTPPDVGPSTPPLTPRTASLIQGPGLITIANTVFRPLTFTTICNICNYPIPPSHTRYHCQKCNAGDYDICMSCYHKLVVSGRISKEDGMNGWRRCLMRHRMVVVGFEDRDGGQRRVVQRDLVGGFAFRDEESGTKSPTGEVAPPPRERPENLRWKDNDGTVHRYRSPSSTTTSPTSTMPAQHQRFPPDGGVGLRLHALWSYWPGENVKDELAFPKNAEIREAENINGDWFWGVYAGTKGLFPGNHGRIVGGGTERLGMI